MLHFAEGFVTGFVVGLLVCWARGRRLRARGYAITRRGSYVRE